MNRIEEMNAKLYKAAEHLYVAGTTLRGDFDDAGATLLIIAEKMLDIIEIPPDKVSEDDMKSILDEIMGIGGNSEPN